MSWVEGEDHDGRKYRERDDGYREYMMSEGIAKIIWSKARGLHGHKKHSWRALSIAVTGIECQMTGKDLERIAAWTLRKEDEL